MNRKLLILFFIFILFGIKAQETNRFFYELEYKPKKDSAKTEKVIMILDINKDKSVYKDYLTVIQDSIAKASFDKILKTGAYEDIKPTSKSPKFSYTVNKLYPLMQVQFTDLIMNGLTPLTIGYEEKISFPWKINPEKQKIGEYNTQKATMEYGGRKWEAWFSTDLPFQDGPYKFWGLPGLIIKIEDNERNYSWVLKGNKKVVIDNQNSLISMLSNGNVKIMEKEKFEKTYNNYKNDPFAAMKGQLSAEILNSKLPGTNTTINDFINKQGKETQNFYQSNDNHIEK